MSMMKKTVAMILASVFGMILTGGVCVGATNTWDGSAWSDGAPTMDDDIVIQGDLDWTSDMVSSVNSWSQSSGTVTFGTTFTGGGFDSFAIGNNAIVSGGTWTHLDNSSNEDYRLSVNVGGSFDLQSGATINAKGRGYDTYQGPGAAVSGGYEEGGSYGGIGGGSSALPYGSLETPQTLGSGGSRSSGGGAVHLSVGGATDIGGEINVDSADNGNSGHGAGGSVYIETASITGAGTLTASCGDDGWGGRGRGGGGRIGIKLTDTGDFSDFQSTATLKATTKNLAGEKGGAGTIYLEDSGGNAQLVVDNDGVSGDFTSAGTTAFAYGSNVSVTTRNGGKLMIENDDTIDFATANLQDGWKVRLAGADNVTVPATWTIENAHLMPDALTEINADLVIGTDGAVTPHERTAVLDLKVNNLTVNDGGALHADTLGYEMSGPGYTDTGDRDGASYGGQGGERGTGGDDSQGPCYGSFLTPTDFGSGTINNPGMGGGAINLTVDGDLAVNGTGRISANGADDDESSGSGGSILINANTLSGDGTIGAEGGDHEGYGAGGGGGRVAVYLSGGDFTGFSGQIQAFADAYNSEDGAGGTVYLQNSADEVNAGNVYIDFNDNSTEKYVELPPTYDTFTDDLSGVGFHLLNGGAVGMHGNQAIRGLTMASETTWHGNGNTLTVGADGISGAGTIDLGNGGMTLATSGTITLSDPTLTGTGTFVKDGAGTVILDNNASIETQVDAGILQINDGITLTGNATVNDGGTLKGKGAIDGAVAVNSGGTLAPGASPGVLTVNDFTLNEGGTLAIELGGWSESTDFDVLNAIGDITFNDSTTLDISFVEGFDPDKSDSWEIATANSISGENLLNLIGPDDLEYWNVEVVDINSQALKLNYTIIPEPATLALLGLGCVTMITRRKRRN